MEKLHLQLRQFPTQTAGQPWGHPRSQSLQHPFKAPEPACLKLEVSDLAQALRGRPLTHLWPPDTMTYGSMRHVRSVSPSDSECTRQR